MAGAAIMRAMSRPSPDAQPDERELSAGWYVFAAACLCILAIVVLARANLPNAREIASMLGIAPHKPVTVALMIASLGVSLGFGSCAAYPLVWWDGRHRRACLVGAAAASTIGALLYVAPSLVRFVAG